MAYEKMHTRCIASLELAFSIAVPNGQKGRVSKRRKPDFNTAETCKKFEKNGLSKKCTYGALQAWSLLFSIAVPIEQQGRVAKCTLPAIFDAVETVRNRAKCEKMAFGKQGTSAKRRKPAVLDTAETGRSSVKFEKNRS